MKELGKIGDYIVYWDHETGEVMVGMETAGRAWSEAEAQEVARNYISKFPNR